MPGKDLVVKWQRVRKQNHLFDALYNACAAGSFVGVRLVDEPSRIQSQRPMVRGWFEQTIRREPRW